MDTTPRYDKLKLIENCFRDLHLTSKVTAGSRGFIMPQSANILNIF